MSEQFADETTQYLRAQRDDHTLACPACDRGQRWYVRSDDTVRCPDCGHECHRENLVSRPSETGQHTPTEACAEGGRTAWEQNDRDSEDMARIGKRGAAVRWGTRNVGD